MAIVPHSSGFLQSFSKEQIFVFSLEYAPFVLAFLRTEVESVVLHLQRDHFEHFAQTSYLRRLSHHRTILFILADQTGGRLAGPKIKSPHVGAGWYRVCVLETREAVFVFFLDVALQSRFHLDLHLSVDLDSFNVICENVEYRSQFEKPRRKGSIEKERSSSYFLKKCNYRTVYQYHSEPGIRYAYL